jgi:hypothetical protein
MPSKPQLRFQELYSLVLHMKRNHSNQQLEKWVDTANEKKKKK